KESLPSTWLSHHGGIRMSDDALGIHGLDDILDDIDGSQKAADKIARFFATRPEEVHERSLRGPSRALRSPDAGRSGRPSAGQQLLTVCRADTCKPYEPLLYLEELFPPMGDHGYLIGPACQLIESELDRLLTEPARGMAEHLLTPLKHRNKDRKLAETLEKWA